MTDSFEKMIRGEHEAKPPSDRETRSARAVLSTREGRRFFYALLGICHFGRSSFAGENVYASQALAGKQLVGEWAMGLLNLTSPEAYSLMVKEAKEDEQHDRSNDAKLTADASSSTAFEPDASADQPR